MIVFVHSLGSCWQQKPREAGGTSVWNTTGIDDAKRLQPRSEVYGQVAFGRRAQLELNGQHPLRPSTWVTSELTEQAGIRKLRLMARASADAVPAWYLVTVNESLIGEPRDDGWDASETQLISYSRWHRRQEVMLLMRPFGWLKTQNGTATLVPMGRGCEWRTQGWSAP